MKPLALAMMISFLFAVSSASNAAPRDVGGVPASRLSRLATGANVCRWFRYPLAETKEHYKNYLGDDDFNLMKRLGIKWVRLCIAPKYLFDESASSKLQPEMLRYIDSAVGQFLNNDIAVMIDIHDEKFLKLDSEEGSGQFVLFWENLASHFRNTDPDRLFLEIVNEPTIEAAKWAELQQKVVKAIRSKAPRHTIVVTGAGWGGIDGLLRLSPLPGKNLLYSFHCYDPFPFTHQGATWASEEVKHVANVPYPSSPEGLGPAIEKTGHSGAKAMLKSYGDQRWDAAKLSARIAQAAEWGRKAGVPVFCGEFGVYPKVSPGADRLRWMRDIRAAFEKHGLGFAVWGYDEGFGLNRQRGSDGKITYDTAAAEALGLK